MLSNQISLVPLQSGWTTAFGASFSAPGVVLWGLRGVIVVPRPAGLSSRLETVLAVNFTDQMEPGAARYDRLRAE